MLCMGCICCRFASFGAMDHVIKRNCDLYAHGSVVLLETEVIVLNIGVLGETAVLSFEVDLWSPEIAGVAEGGLALGTRNGVGGLNCRTSDRAVAIDLRRNGGKGGDSPVGC